MIRIIQGLVAFSLIFSSSVQSLLAEDVDPFLWLEEVEGGAALEWVRARNDRAQSRLSAHPEYQTLEAEARAIVLAKDRVPYPTMVHGGYVYNFWQDEINVQGLWRRTSLAEYEKSAPAWETLLDVDALGRAENETWVWKGVQSLPPERTRCLITLSRGGKDASVVREFDLQRKIFVERGFELPEAKSSVTWVDIDHLLVGTDFGQDSLTDSGYPRLVKLWTRNTPLSAARVLFEGKKEDVDVSAFTEIGKDGTHIFIIRAPSFFTQEVYYVENNYRLQKVPVPADSQFQGVFKGHLLFSLRSDWQTQGSKFEAGSLISIKLGEWTNPRPEIVFHPTDRSSLQGVSSSENFLYLTISESVQGRMFQAEKSTGGWNLKRLDLPDFGSLSMVAMSDAGNVGYVEYDGFLKPPTLYQLGQLESGAAFKSVKQTPERFQSDGFKVEQMEATSKDGTKIPYFVIRSEKLPFDGQAPTLLYGYGGFEIPMTPGYLGLTGKHWLSRGGVYVLSNIRGGGEFGPKWHQAAILENKQKSYDDFIAIAEDLIHRKITSPEKLGIMGGSNGGLLMGAVLTQRPDLFKAVVIQVPLLDMLRYHELLAGASWMGEYGDPDDPRMREIIARYSPYQNVKPGVKYPIVFIETSTKDDRVHPAHARKMVAKLEALGNDVHYFENIEGGHSAAANLEQGIRRVSMECSYLLERLSPPK